MTDQAFSFLVAGGVGGISALLTWLVVHRRPVAKVRVADRARSNRAELRAWIEQHMPELDAELGPMSLDQVRIRLNEVTGCGVMGTDSVELGNAVFLAALKVQHERRTKD